MINKNMHVLLDQKIMKHPLCKLILAFLVLKNNKLRKIKILNKQNKMMRMVMNMNMFMNMIMIMKMEKVNMNMFMNMNMKKCQKN